MVILENEKIIPVFCLLEYNGSSTILLTKWFTTISNEGVSMKVIDNGVEYIVLVKIFEGEEVSYLTVGKNNEIYFFSGVKRDELIEKGAMVNKYNTDNNTISELDYINKEVCYKIWFNDYVSEKEEKEYDEIKNNIMLDYKHSLSKKIKKEYYREKIRKNELELWENNFDDNVYQVEENKYYIDDKEFDIFYEISGNNYKFEFFEK